VAEKERASRVAEPLGRAGFADLGAPTAGLSGGWRKRLAIVEGLVQAPDVLLLDEPTNHLDLAGIEWLETLLQDAPFACVVVSHDRYFLENVATAVVELSRSYENGFLRVNGAYTEFLEAKENFLHAQRQRHEALENLVHKEIEWLRRGAKARTRKSKARIDTAQGLIGELADLNARTRMSSAQIDFSSTDRKTKRLITLDNVTHGMAGRTLFSGIHFTVTSGMRVGLVGPNGSGKTTLLRLIRGDVEPEQGEIKRADSLRVVYFDQNRELDPSVSLRRALAPDSDSVIYQDAVIHVAAWAAKFLFDAEDLGQPVGKLSGGERARVLIAQLMLQPADVLLLDEPTNDLDIPTLEILEESLLEFRGALILVTHDRFMLDRVSTAVLGLDGLGAAQHFADYTQWETWQRARKRETASAVGTDTPKPSERSPAKSESKSAGSRRRLSYLEVRELDGIEVRIQEADKALETRKAALEDPSITSDPQRLREACIALDEAQGALNRLYERWEELEKKKSSA
jgi:ATP-binding cassette subfamily F protein uup